jgi:membrane fusion protein, multidrug efflux system
MAHKHTITLSIPLLTLLFFISLLVSCSEQGGGGGGFSMPPMPVETATVERQTIADRFDAVGTLEAINQIEVVAEISGRVISLPFNEGHAINKGDVIALIDDEQLKAEESRANAVVDQRRADYNRTKGIVDQGLGMTQELDAAAALLKVAEADLAVVTARLAKTRIVAPFSGITGARRVSVGHYLNALSGETITELTQVNEMKVTFFAPERFYGTLKHGAEVNVSTTAYSGYSLTGQIDVIEPMIDPTTRNAKIVAKFRNVDGKFRPGMSANVTAILSQRDSALTVPDEAVLAEGNQLFVYVINADSTVAIAPITIGTRTASAVEVTSGLTAGQQVVRAGHQKIGPGSKVMAMPPGGMMGGQPAGGAPQ